MATGFDFVSIVKLAPRYVAAIAIASGVVLFVPESAITSLGLAQFKTAVHPWLGGAFILSCSLLLVHWLITFWRWAVAKRRAAERRRALHQRLHTLTADEQKLLRFFIENRTRTQKLDIKDGVVGGLESARIVYKSAEVGSVFAGWDYNIQPWAYDYWSAPVEIWTV